MSKKRPPSVVLIGRTNAGKSTLFNRLTEERKAIVSSAENTTRDQTRSTVYWKGNMFELIDTGGLDTTALDPLDQDIQNQVKMALEKADAVIFVVDGSSDSLPQDWDAAVMLRDSKVPVIMCVNKIDNEKKRREAIGEFEHLPHHRLVLCSAINGSGTGDLLDEVLEEIPAFEAPEVEDDSDKIMLTLVGRPNVGKSTIFNALVGEDRVIVSDIAHTTRDINDTTMTYQDQKYVLLDTAGIRKKSKVGNWKGRSDKKQMGAIEKSSIHAALKSIERADVVALVVEAGLQINKQDKVLMDYAQYHGKGMMVVINKWDLIPDKDPSTINEFNKYFQFHLKANYVPLVFVSGLEKQRVTDIFKQAAAITAMRSYEMPQEDLDNILKTIMKHAPKEQKKLIAGQPKKLLELKSITQVGINPPAFRIRAAKPKNVATAIVHKIKKMIRDRADYTGVPIKVFIEKK